jgi:hypothetical protein
MKHQIAIVAAVALAMHSFAQTTRLNVLLNEVNTNFNYGSANNSLSPYKKTVAGIQAGLSFQAGITPTFSVVTEAYFTMKGGTLQTGNPLTTEKSTTRLYATELPVLARFQFGKVYLNSGPYAAYNFSGTLKTEGQESTSPAFNRWEMGLQAGVGYLFHIKKLPLALDVRYGYGLTNISQDVERYNRALTVSLLLFKPWKQNPFAKKP